jgi:hypothetical protein
MAAEAAIGDPQADRSSVTMKPMSRIALLRQTTPIAITGLRGAGKTLLYESLIGKVGQSGVDYVVKGRSNDVEKHKTLLISRNGKIRIGAIVIPGQDSDERGAALGKYFSGGKFPAGVIHVVCWGYNRIWESYERQSVRQELSVKRVPVDLEAVNKWNLNRELRDFTDTCQLLKDAWGTRKKQVWLIIAVAKCDLFWPQMADVRDYYIPNASVSAPREAAQRESEFCGILRDFVGYVGEANCRLAVVPVSCYPEEYMFEPGIARAAEANPARTQVLVNTFRNMVGEFCARQVGQ